MPVVLANGFGGTLFHEACGHGLEADAIAKGASIYAGKMGEVVAAPIVSAYDDGSIANGWGSQAFDDEGVPTQKTLVIEDGRLTGYLYDRLRAREAGAAPTGNGRRQSFRHVPIPRMTTTYIAPGDATPEEIIAATPTGSTPRAWPAARSSRPAATSSSASPRATSSSTAASPRRCAGPRWSATASTSS